MKTIKMIKLNYLIKRLFVFFTNLVLFILFFLIGNALAPRLETWLMQIFYEQAISTSGYFNQFTGSQITWIDVTAATPFFISVIFLFILNSIFLVKYRKTLGQKLFALELVKTNNERPSLFSIIVLRNIIFILSVFAPAIFMLSVDLLSKKHWFEWGWVFILLVIVNLIDYLFIFRKDRRCLHDLIAGTKVVERK